MEFRTAARAETGKMGGGLNNGPVTVHGMVHALRDMGGFAFLTLRRRDGTLQCVCPGGMDLDGACEECAVELEGVMRREGRAPGGYELEARGIRVLSRPAAPLPVPVSKHRLNLNLDTELGLRSVALRNLRRRAVFRLQAGLCRAFRDYLQAREFTEIHTPKTSAPGRRAAPTSSGWTISAAGPISPSPPSSTSRPWWGCMSGCSRRPPCSGPRSTPQSAT